MSFLQRDVIAVTLSEIDTELANATDFETLVSSHERLIAKLTSLLLLKNQAVMQPLAKVVEAARLFASLVTHRRSEEKGWKDARNKFDTNLNAFITEMKECQSRFSYVHVSDFLAAVDFNDYYLS